MVGLGLRLALGGGGVGDRSALVMATLLSVGAWLAARLLSTPPTAFLVTLGVIGPARPRGAAGAQRAGVRLSRGVLPYRPGDHRAGAPGVAAGSADAGAAGGASVPPAGEAQPRFGLAGEVGSAALAWDCAFQRGLQHLALPVPLRWLARDPFGLHLTGSPTRETDYLLVYASAPRGGFLVSLVGAADVAQATVCDDDPCLLDQHDRAAAWLGRRSARGWSGYCSAVALLLVRCCRCRATLDEPLARRGG